MKLPKTLAVSALLGVMLTALTAPSAFAAPGAPAPSLPVEVGEDGGVYFARTAYTSDFFTQFPVGGYEGMEAVPTTQNVELSITNSDWASLRVVEVEGTALSGTTIANSAGQIDPAYVDAQLALPLTTTATAEAPQTTWLNSADNTIPQGSTGAVSATIDVPGATEIRATADGGTAGIIHGFTLTVWLEGTASDGRTYLLPEVYRYAAYSGVLVDGNGNVCAVDEPCLGFGAASPFEFSQIVSYSAPVAVPPTAEDVYLTTAPSVPVDGSINITLGSSEDLISDLTLSEQDPRGQWVVNTDFTVTYTPSAEAVEQRVSARYTITDSNGATASAFIYVDVSAAETAPPAPAQPEDPRVIKTTGDDHAFVNYAIAGLLTLVALTLIVVSVLGRRRSWKL